MIQKQVDALNASFERLSGREQGLAVLLVAMILGMVVGLTTHFVGKDLKRRNARIASKVKQLETLAGLRNNYRRRLSDQRRLAAEIKRNNKTRLLSYIEEVSSRANTQIKNAAERSGQPTGSDVLKEVAAEVTVENVSIDRLYDFLTRIETGNRLIKIRKLEIKSRFDNPKMLDAKVTVGTLKTTES